MFRLSITAYPWDLDGPDVAAILDRLQGEVGVNGLSVWVAGRPVTQIRVRDMDPKIYHTRGGLFFQSLAPYYARTRCKPALASRLPARYSLEATIAACDERSLELRGIISAARFGRLADRYPEFASRSVFGMESRRSVCLANADVQECVLGVARELVQRFALKTVVLTDFYVGWFEAFEANFNCSSALTPATRELMSICFCESCNTNSTAAGVNVDDARERLRVIVQRAIETGTPMGGSVAALLAEHTALAGHVRCQTEAMNALLKRPRADGGGEIQVCRDGQFPRTACDTGVDLNAADGTMTAINTIADAKSVERSRSGIHELLIPAEATIGESGGQLVAGLHEAAVRGFSGVEIDNLGVLPEASFDTLRQAIRFARRSVQ